MTLKKRLRAGSCVSLIIFLIFAAVSYSQIRWIEWCITRLTDVEAPKNEAASRMEVNLVGTGFELLKYLQDHDPVRIERIQSYKDDFREYQSIYCRQATTAEAERSAVAVDRNSALLGKMIEELINLEDYHIQRLEFLRANFDEIDEILSEGFKAHSQSAEQSDYKKLGTVMEMKGKTDEIRRNLESYLKDYKQQYESKMLEAHKELGDLLNIYKDLHVVSEHKEWFERFGNVHARNLVLIKEIVALDKNKRARLGKFVGAREKLRLILGSNIEKSQANFEDARQASYRAIGISAIVTLLLVFIGMVVVLISQAYISYSVTLPITELRDAAAKINQGQYDTKVEITSDDELGQLAESINRIAGDLRRFNASPEQAPEREEAGVSA